ncbi:hypothetical protein ACA910_014780 [Epithemia clementina (nom. ined.)]
MEEEPQPQEESMVASSSPSSSTPSFKVFKTITILKLTDDAAIGIELKKKTNEDGTFRYSISDIEEDSPADHSKLRQGHCLHRINDTSVQDLSKRQVHALLESLPPGEITLTVSSNNNKKKKKSKKKTKSNKSSSSSSKNKRNGAAAATDAPEIYKDEDDEFSASESGSETENSSLSNSKSTLEVPMASLLDNNNSNTNKSKFPDPADSMLEEEPMITTLGGETMTTTVPMGSVVTAQSTTATSTNNNNKKNNQKKPWRFSLMHYGAWSIVLPILSFFGYIFFSINAFSCKVFENEFYVYYNIFSADNPTESIKFGYWGARLENGGDECQSFDKDGIDDDGAIKFGRAIGVLGGLLGGFTTLFYILAAFIYVPVNVLRVVGITVGTIMAIMANFLWVGLLSDSCSGGCTVNAPAFMGVLALLIYIVLASNHCCCFQGCCCKPGVPAAAADGSTNRLEDDDLFVDTGGEDGYYETTSGRRPPHPAH